MHRYITLHRYNHDPNTHANILSNPHYTHKHKRRHIHANRHMRELKCPRNTHEHKDKHKRYVHSQQKALTQDRKVVDARGWCVWVRWGNLLQGDTISGHRSVHMGTDDLCFARMAGGGNKSKNNTAKYGGRKGGGKAKRTQRADTSPRHCIYNAKHNRSEPKRAIKKRNRPKQHNKQNAHNNTVK